MTDGLQDARERRNALERLGEKIPGFRGFQDRELRRDVDKLQREHLAAQLSVLKGRVREVARAYTDAGLISSLGGLDRLERRLDGLSQTVRFADYGVSGFFDAVKIGEEELDALYRFDLSLLEDLSALTAAVTALPPPAPSPEGGLGPATARVLEQVEALEGKWRSRELMVSNVVKTV